MQRPWVSLCQPHIVVLVRCSDLGDLQVGVGHILEVVNVVVGSLHMRSGYVLVRVVDRLLEYSPWLLASLHIRQQCLVVEHMYLLEGREVSLSHQFRKFCYGC